MNQLPMLFTFRKFGVNLTHLLPSHLNTSAWNNRQNKSKSNCKSHLLEIMMSNFNGVVTLVLFMHKMNTLMGSNEDSPRSESSESSSDFSVNNLFSRRLRDAEPFQVNMPGVLNPTITFQSKEPLSLVNLAETRRTSKELPTIDCMALTLTNDNYERYVAKIILANKTQSAHLHYGSPCPHTHVTVLSDTKIKRGQSKIIDVKKLVLKQLRSSISLTRLFKAYDLILCKRECMRWSFSGGRDVNIADSVVAVG
eukprot:423978_1